MHRIVAGLVVAAVAGIAGGPARAAETDAAARAARATVTAAWAGVPLRSVADRLAAAGGVAVVIDRRIDPDRAISLDASGRPLADVLAEVAAAAGGEAVAYAGHLRIVPRGLAARFQAADAARAREHRALAPAIRGRIRAEAAWSWPAGATPRDLISTAADAAGFTIADLAGLPHDHFPAAALPPLALADRLDLVLAHFDRRVSWRRPSPRSATDAATATIVPLEPAGPAAESRAARAPIASSPPSPRRDDRPPQPAPAATYTLTVAAPLDELLATLARRFGLALDLDAASLRRRGVAPGEIVKLEIRDATRADLLDAILAPRGLTWRIEEATLSVSAAAP